MHKINRERIATLVIWLGAALSFIGLIFFLLEFMPVDGFSFITNDSFAFYKIVPAEGSSLNWHLLISPGVLLVINGLLLRRKSKNTQD